MKYLISYQKENNKYSEQIEANSKEEAVMMAKQQFGESAVVDGLLFMEIPVVEGKLESQQEGVEELVKTLNTPIFFEK